MLNNSSAKEPKAIRHSDEVNEIILTLPYRLFHLTRILLLSVFLMVISLLWFIRYPDIIQTKITIIHSAPPNDDVLVASADTQIPTLLNVHPGDAVKIIVDSGQSAKSAVRVNGKIDSQMFKSHGRIDTFMIQLSDESKHQINIPRGTVLKARIVTEDVSIFARIFKKFEHTNGR